MPNRPLHLTAAALPVILASTRAADGAAILVPKSSLSLGAAAAAELGVRRLEHRMQFKVPPGNLSWLSGLWVLLGAFVSYTSFANGDTYLGVMCLLFVIAGGLIWLDIRAIAWPLIVWFGLVILGALVLLAFKGLAFRPFWAIAMASLTIYDLYQWHKSD